MKLTDLVGLALPRFYNASKIKLYEVDLPKSSPSEAERTSKKSEDFLEQDVNLDLLFSEPLVASIQLDDVFHQSWEFVAYDDTSSVISGTSQATLQC